jgi:hypothetical protein
MKCRKPVLYFSLLAVVSSFSCVVANATEVGKEILFSSGYAKMDITPKLGTTLSGYYSRRVSNGVLDPLYARCVAVSDGDVRALVITVDNVHLMTSVSVDIRKAVSSATGVPIDAVFLACTHTHTGPVSHVPSLKPDCFHWEKQEPEDSILVKEANLQIEKGCAAAANAAIADLAPAEMLIGRGEAKGISFVRRYRMKDGTVRTNPGLDNPNIECALGESDEQLQLVRFVRKGKKEIALVNFQCHPDTIGGNKFSADWPGLACTYIENAMDGSVDAIFINGAQGDTNHLRTKKNPGEVIPQSYEMAKHMGRVVAGAALSVWGVCAPATAGKVQFAVKKVKAIANKARAEDVPLAVEYAKLHQAGRAREIPGKGMEQTANIAAAYRILELKDSPDEVDIPVSVISIGKTLAFGGLPGEPFTWIGTEIKRRSPFAMTFPACCVNGQYDYFPVKSAFADGGYENASSRFKAGVAERLVEGMLVQLQEFYGKTKMSGDR